MTRAELVNKLRRLQQSSEEHSAVNQRIRSLEAQHVVQVYQRKLPLRYAYFHWWILVALAIWLFILPFWQALIALAVCIFLADALIALHNLAAYVINRFKRAKQPAIDEHNAQLAATIASLQASKQQLMAEYDDMGGEEFYPLNYTAPHKVGFVASLIEQHRANSVTEAINLRESLLDQEQRDQELRGHRARVESNQRAAINSQIVSDMVTRWSIEDSIRRHR